MTTLVRDDPAPCASSPGHDRIANPRRKPGPGERNEQICEHSATERHRQGNKQVKRRFDQTAIKAFLWNRSKHLGFCRIPLPCFRNEGCVIVNGCRGQGIFYKTGTRHDDLPTTKKSDDKPGGSSLRHHRMSKNSRKTAADQRSDLSTSKNGN